MCAPNLKSAASSDTEILRGPEISKLGTFPRRRLLAGQFVILGQEEPRIHVRTKFEQRSFIRSTDVEGVPKIRNSARTPGHAHLGANLWSACKNSPGSMCAPNLRSVASSDREILRGSRNFEIGHVPQPTPTWRPICRPWARTAQDPRAHQI